MVLVFLGKVFEFGVSKLSIIFPKSSFESFEKLSLPSVVFGNVTYTYLLFAARLQRCLNRILILRLRLAKLMIKNGWRA